MEKKGILYYFNQVEEKILVYSFAFTVVLVFIQVVMRSVFNSSLSWSEELARYMFIWQCWISVSLAERYKVHIRIEMMIKNLPHTLRLGVEYLVIMITLAINIFFIYWGVKMVWFLIGVGTTSTALSIPMYIIYIAMPIGCATYATRLVINFFRLIKGKEVIN